MYRRGGGSHDLPLPNRELDNTTDYAGSMTTTESEVRVCSIARTLDLVGEKWSLLAVRELMLGNHRFDQIIRRTGAPRDILTTRLRKLEGSGLVERVVYQDRPIRHEYRLTDAGWSLLPIITVLRDWGDTHLAGPDGPPIVFRHECGAILEPAVVCGACGETVAPGPAVRVESDGRSPDA